MSGSIAVVGATGDLGGRVVAALLARGVQVKALVRPGTSPEKLAKLSRAETHAVVMTDRAQVAGALAGVECLVSTVQGLGDVIVDTQSALVEAAAVAGVPRFIPSDFSSDFSQLSQGDNRNFDLRRAFHRRVEKAKAALTSIFNGAFADMLAYGIPFFDYRAKKVHYFGEATSRVDFTTKDDVAAFTAEAAMDPSIPSALRIASFQISAAEIAALASEVSGTPFELVRLGSIEELAASNRRDRAAHPEGENEVFPAWQRSQYMHSMMSTRMEKLDNARYPSLTWTSARDMLTRILRRP